MKKNILSLLLLAGMFSAANAQTYKGRVGVNTTTPASTMDIVGDPADDKVTDGLIAPRLTGDELKACHVLKKVYTFYINTKIRLQFKYNPKIDLQSPFFCNNFSIYNLPF